MGKLTVTFWGVRGSIPAPGPHTTRYGGNTSCVEVRAGGELLIFDMGSGLRALGDSLKGKARGTIFLSHYHWDHIQGLPFFRPAFDPSSSFALYGAARDGHGIEELLSGQMVAPYFPVPIGIFRAKLSFHSTAPGETIEIGEARVRVGALNHPNGALGYRVECGSSSLVYATDHEHTKETDEGLVELARNADVLIYDSMYTPEEYSGQVGFSRVGWGHSTWRAAVETAERAGVKRLFLFHHEPARTDADLEAILATARARYPNTELAREGERFEIDP